MTDIVKDYWAGLKQSPQTAYGMSDFVEANKAELLRHFDIANCGPLDGADGMTWAEMSFSEARAWLLKDMGLT